MEFPSYWLESAPAPGTTEAIVATVDGVEARVPFHRTMTAEAMEAARLEALGCLFDVLVARENRRRQPITIA